MLARLTQTYGAPLLVKNTFLHFELVVRPCRAESAPPLRTPALERRAPPRDDDEEALAAGRRQTLCETWRLWAHALLSASATKRREALGRQIPRRRVTLTRAGFAQATAAVGYDAEEIFLLAREGLLKIDENDSVEIWCDEGCHETPRMKTLLAQAELVRDISVRSFFVEGVEPEIYGVAPYEGKQTVGDLKRMLAVCCGVAAQGLRLTVLGDSSPLLNDSARLKATAVRPGCCVRVTRAV